MLPGPTNVPERVTRAMVTPSINHRSDDFVDLYEECVDNTKKIFETDGDAVCLSASGTGAVECSVVNLVKKDDKVIIPVNGEFSSRLAQQIEWAGGQAIKIETEPGINATFDQVKEAFDNNKDVKAFYCVWNETSTGTMINYLDRIKDLTSRNDSYYVLDGVSIVGGEELHMDKWGIDIHTPFTPALPVLYAYREAMRIMLEEGMENRIQRHRICSDALYSGLSAIGLSPFADENSRSTVVIALNYLDGLEDKIFRDTLSQKFRILVAGGFGNLKGKVFRVGCMGEVHRYHVMRCISGIASTLAMMGYDTDAQAGLKVAEEKLKPLDSL